jgi:hypothetical protein
MRMIELNYVAYHNNKRCRVLTVPLNDNKILIEYIDSKIRKEVRLDDVEKLQYVEPEVYYGKYQNSNTRA